MAAILALAIHQDTEVIGWKVPGSGEEEQEVLTFVDDSTVGMQETQRLFKVMNQVKQFEWMSRLAGTIDNTY